MILGSEKFIKSFDGQKLKIKFYQNSPDFRIKNKIVFVHGLANSGQVWEGVINVILEKHLRTKCIVYDLRGHGQSSKKFSHLSGTRLELIHACDLQVVIKKFAGWRPILVGHSLGGIVIQEYLNINHLWWRDPKEVFLLATNIRTRRIKNLNRDKIMENFAKINKYEEKTASALALDEYMRTIGKSDFNWRTILQTATSIPLESSLLHWLGALNWENSNPKRIDRKNVMLIYGKNDKIFPSEQIKSTIAQSKKMRSLELKAEHGLNVSAAPEVAVEIGRVL